MWYYAAWHCLMLRNITFLVFAVCWISEFVGGHFRSAVRSHCGTNCWWRRRISRLMANCLRTSAARNELRTIRRAKWWKIDDRTSVRRCILHACTWPTNADTEIPEVAIASIDDDDASDDDVIIIIMHKIGREWRHSVYGVAQERSAIHRR